MLIFIICCGLLDSLNWVTIAGLIYLLTAPKPLLSTLSFLGGILLAYFGGGIIILLGLDKLITDVIEQYDLAVIILEIILGSVLIFLGYRYRQHTKPTEPGKPKSLKPIHTFLFGFSVTLTDIPTAFPYLAAITRITQTNLPFIAMIFLLLLYNLLYQLPLLSLLAIYYITREKSANILERIYRFMGKWTIPVTIIFFFLFGLFLISDGIAGLFGHPLI